MEPSQMVPGTRTNFLHIVLVQYLVPLSFHARRNDFNTQWSISAAQDPLASSFASDISLPSLTTLALASWCIYQWLWCCSRTARTAC
ncbi:hypothetical protein DUNSADRAFT_4684 [Dunaliella salina]|uniref:Encoded protein n=1 Tax=Dunaliella salina TaxID=3046 RepID=A0ABQ7FUP9_DUNSA|nr:hypothetical protein DUNSADRAFT_4684 [Dunaliella salina]|eukprot:KAF5826128.1 hypothetical protein DUNSADRAFT_4684 [Dunaliella salina]